MSDKEKVLFTREQETLLVPLYSKAMESRRPNPIFRDEKAEEILARVEYDFTQLKVPRKTAITLCLRATKLDAYTREFLARQPQGIVLHLGCGLDARHLRVDHRSGEWYDLDMPLVIDLRRKFYQETATHHMIPSSVTDWSWLEQVAPNGRPVLAVAEGLLMYLAEEDVRTLVQKLKDRFPGGALACDVYSTLTAERANAHPSIKKTGAVLRWGIDEARTVESWGEGIRLREEWYFAQAPEIERLGPLYRLDFKLAGRFAAANKAHRIVYYGLGQNR